MYLVCTRRAGHHEVNGFRLALGKLERYPNVPFLSERNDKSVSVLYPLIDEQPAFAQETSLRDISIQTKPRQLVVASLIPPSESQCLILHCQLGTVGIVTSPDGAPLHNERKGEDNDN